MNICENQQTANLLSFYTDSEMAHRKDVLLKLTAEMKKNEVKWALTCSCAFFFRGMVDEFHDYDVIVEKESINKFIEIFKAMGGQLNEGQDGKEKFFDSKIFLSGELQGIEFDVISSFTVTTYGKRYCYELQTEHIEYIKEVIPVSPVESCMLLYGMMIEWQPIRRLKYELAKDYLRTYGIKYPEILNVENMPPFIKNDIQML